MAIDNGNHPQVTNHVPSPYDPHYPNCPHANVCPHCGAPKMSGPYIYPQYPSPYYPSYPYPVTITYTNTTHT